MNEDRNMRMEPRRGELYVLHETADFPIQWLVLEITKTESISVVPVDDHPLIGSRDVAIRDSEYNSDLVARCAEAIEAPATAFRKDLRVGEVPGAELNRVLDRLRSVRSAGEPVATVRDRTLEEVDRAPEYVDWMAEVVRPATNRLRYADSPRGIQTESPSERPTLATSREAVSPQPVPSEPARSTRAPLLARAALVLVGASLGVLGTLIAISPEPNHTESTTRANAPVYLLLQSETERGEGAPVAPGSHADEIVIAVSAIDRHLYSTYRLEVSTVSEPAPRLRVGGLVPSEQGLLSVSLSRDLLAGESVRFSLFAEAETSAEPLATYRLEFANAR